MNFIDLFAGAGGLSEGFIRAGFTPVAHVEMDSAACYTLRTRMAYHHLAKQGRLDIYHSYLSREISRRDLYSHIPESVFNSIINQAISEENNSAIFAQIDELLDGQEVDLIIGGPPCQAYSNIGRAALKHVKDDHRKKLYVEYGKFLKRYKPKVFVFENVPGLKSSDTGIHYQNIKEYFDKIGYHVEEKQLNARSFGVVQDRKRLIFIGWSKDIQFEYPSFNQNETEHTSEDIFYDLPSLQAGGGTVISEYVENTSEYLTRSEIRRDDDILTQHITRPHNVNDLSIYKLAVQKYQQGLLLKNNEIPDTMRTQKNVTDFLDRFKVVGSIPHTLIAHIAKDGHHYIYNSLDQNRSISVREAARIQSFPDSYYFEGVTEIFSRTAAFKQIGNAVPPLMAYKIACQIEVGVREINKN
ncbi:DNA cytosine methyltransferase [Petrimonas sulfuriphila]|jgi:DNA (cytosine-5)-methyltransferase 1|uniref:DNA cytosine methyltransferase n=1 Tax=Petrimonas sulfuriphila TaxID=285070 RepID=UPI003EBE64AA